jgi:hypothetical protein
VIGVALLGGCGPKAHIPPRPVIVPGALADADSGRALAQRLAPLLYLQADEVFQLSRAVAVVHPTRPIIAYHLLWRDDAHGAWIPFTKPTDQEVVWVGFDSTGAATELWTYWHGTLLHTDWRNRGPVLIDVQWGKHGSLPRRTRLADLPWTRKMTFYWLAGFAVPDLALGTIFRNGPWCFCHGYGRYRRFDRPLPVADRLDAVVRLENPDPALRAVFGEPYSEKGPWP